MQTGMLRWLVLPMGLLALAGCQRSESAATKIAPVAPTQPFIFYDAEGGPSERTPALSEVELREIIAWVATQTSDPVWLIRVKPSLPPGVRGEVIAYITPDEMTPRIRTGRAYDVPAMKGHTGNHVPWKYYQVSVAGHDFGTQLTKPSVTEMPFGPPVIADRNPERRWSAISKEEIVAIIDFVRRPSGYDELPAPKGVSKDRWIQWMLELPIYDLMIMDGMVHVRFGYMHGPLNGYGFMVIVECASTGYRIRGWSDWES